MLKKIKVIAIDGTSASGKGTLAQHIAKRFNYHYLDTGKLYRYVAYLFMQNNVNNTNYTETDFKAEIIKLAQIIDFTQINNIDLSSETIAKTASHIASFQEVRNILNNYQKKFARKSPGVVIDGRDIGTVICPNADVKFYVDADLKTRADRRYQQICQYLANPNKASSYHHKLTNKNIYNQLKERDIRDKTRTNAPLLKAIDAIEIDSTNMTIQEVFDFIIQHILKMDK